MGDHWSQISSGSTRNPARDGLTKKKPWNPWMIDQQLRLRGCLVCDSSSLPIVGSPNNWRRILPPMTYQKFAQNCTGAAVVVWAHQLFGLHPNEHAKLDPWPFFWQGVSRKWSKQPLKHTIFIVQVKSSILCWLCTSVNKFPEVQDHFDSHVCGQYTN